ncbi:MAG: HAD family hydrolase [Luteolibacter sp.]
MRVAIVHYHQKPGGVTSVIAATSRNLGIPHVILSSDGEHPIPALGYDPENRGCGVSPESLLGTLRATATRALGGPPDLWHFHNPTLGKNPNFPGLIELLAEAGERLLLHIHDLAEDGRPQNYRSIPPRYPIGPHIHYAFINSLDRQRFIQSGLPESHAHLLPNPILPCGESDGVSAEKSSTPLLFAPIRAIRRKNIGELILLASQLPPGARISISRAPENPEWLPIYRRWKSFATAQNLPIDFEAVQPDAPFESWVARATHFVTTSIAEGFGLPFFEAAQLGKPLIGRDLPHLTDHPSLDRRGLYRSILVPAEWINEQELRKIYQKTYTDHFRDYHRAAPPPPPLSENGSYDFGNLPESIQRDIILKIKEVGHSCPTHLDEIRDRNVPAPYLKSWLTHALDLPPLPPVTFPPQNLLPVYRNILNQKPGPVSFLDPSRILDAYLPEFHFLKTAPPWTPRAVLFDLYGTLLIARAGGVKPDPTADPMLRTIIRNFGHIPPDSPSTALHEAVLRHHSASAHTHPEIDLRELWREVLGLSPEADTTDLVIVTEAAWHPSCLMPFAEETLHALAASGLPLGIISNAQINSRSSLGPLAGFFAPDLTVFSYQHGIAKPSPELFRIAVEKLAVRGISPKETLYIGNDSIQDILPAAAVGFKTALFTGHPDSLRPGHCKPDFEINCLDRLLILT